MPRTAKHATFLFPFGGINEGTSKYNQPPNTAYFVQNVRAFDYDTGRMRGGKRPGLAKVSTTQINGSNRIQDISHVVYASTGSSSSTTVAVRAINAVAVAGGTVKTFDHVAGTVSAVTGGTGALSSTVPIIFSVPFFGKIYFVDGTNYKVYTPGTTTIATWTSSNGGTLPTDGGNTARLIEVWRGRVVLSGVKSDPQNWFMSEVNDALDYNYAPQTITETQAVAGNTGSPAGFVGDIVNGMIPYNDDVLIFGGDHTLFQLTGDPAAGGRIDRISDSTGMAWGRAWCKDANGIVYFMGSLGGIYAMEPGKRPEKISARAIDLRTKRLVGQSNIVRMAYSDSENGVYVWVTPLSGNATTNFYYDLRTGGFFLDRYSDLNHNPVAIDVIDGDDPDDRVLVLGGGDGYLRKIAESETDDDASAIDSRVIFGPIQSIDEGAASQFLLTELQLVLSEGSDDVDYFVYVGCSPESSISAEADSGGDLLLESGGGDRLLLETGDVLLLEGGTTADGTFSAICSSAVYPRRTGYAAYVELRNDDADEKWAMETLKAKIQVLPKSRKRRF